MHSTYKTSSIQQLRDQQVRFAPRTKKLEQVDRAERLLGELDPKRTYTYEYLCYRITDYRPDASLKLTMPGEEARHDVRLFVEDVSDAADLRAADMLEPVHTVDDLSRLFKVSTKTISRWRQQGLVSRRFIFGGGRKRIGFLQSSVDRFVARHHDRVKRSERFSQLSANERSEIIEKARRLAQNDACQSETARRIANQLGRSVEAVRYTLKQFDREYPHLAIFPDNSGPLSDDRKNRIYRDYRRGSSVEDLARRFKRTRASVYRIINEMRAGRILELPLDCIFNDDFENPAMEETIMGPLPDADPSTRSAKVPAGLPPYLAALYKVPLLTREQEYHLFRKFNFLKHSASRLREKLNPSRATTRMMDKIEKLYDEAVRTKNEIVQANLRLVVSIAKRHMNGNEDFFGLISDGNMSLIRAVEKFDYARGNKFSTYASWAIMRNFARTIPGEFKHRDRFRTSQDEAFMLTEDSRTNQYQQESNQFTRERQVEKILDRLDDREQKIIISRFGLNHEQEPQTLKEVGAQLGVTKERIRQIESRALNKMRMVAEEEGIELVD